MQRSPRWTCRSSNPCSVRDCLDEVQSPGRLWNLILYLQQLENRFMEFSIDTVPRGLIVTRSVPTTVLVICRFMLVSVEVSTGSHFLNCRCSIISNFDIYGSRMERIIFSTISRNSHQRCWHRMSRFANRLSQFGSAVLIAVCRFKPWLLVSFAGSFRKRVLFFFFVDQKFWCNIFLLRFYNMCVFTLNKEDLLWWWCHFL